jgi:hypothetical protein
MKLLLFLFLFFFSFTSQAAWITHPDMASLEPLSLFARQLDRGKIKIADKQFRNRHYLFRKSFNLSNLSPAILRITADDYYKLYINGEFVAMGPAAGTLDCTYFNEIDVSKYLKLGCNTIAVHTYYQGLINRVWVSGDNRHGLYLELERDGKKILKSDETFKVARHFGFTSMGIVGYDTQFMEWYNSGAPEVGFEKPSFDDKNWVNAVFHPHGEDYKLVKQPSKMVVTEDIKPVEIKRLDNGVLRIDFGGVYVGMLKFASRGKRLSHVLILCGQELNLDGSVRHKLRANCNYVEKMVLSGSERDVLNQFDYKSFRYAELRPQRGVAIEEDSIVLVARHQPFELKAKPNFSDPVLKPVWDLCVDTFRYGVQEQIMDCMEREKGYYLGDGCYTMFSYCLLTKDWIQARKFFEDFLRTKKIDRGLVTCANCSFMQEIAEYPLMMILFAHWYLEESGDEEFIKKHFSDFADIIDVYRERYAREDGLLTNLDKWCVVEWPKNFQDGYDADVREGKVCKDVHNAINAWYIISIRSLNAIAKRLNIKPYADVEALEKTFRRVFWDSERHLFVDREGSKHISMPGNVYAMFARLSPPEDKYAHKEFLRLAKNKGFSAISLFQFVPLFMYLHETGEKEVLHDFLVSPDAWLRSLREGATRTFEGWGRDTKWNTSLFHLTMASVVMFLTDTSITIP